jgi:outer membrane protein assembly factor BamB
MPYLRRSPAAGLTVLTILLSAPADADSTPAPEATSAAEWPQYRGQERDGVSRVSGLARGWGEAGPARVFKRSLGAGFSGMAVAGGRVFTLAAPAEAEELFCLDVASGATLWSRPLGERFTNELGDGPRSTPTVVGDTVYAVSSRMRLVAVAVADGTPRWERDLVETFGGKVPRFGFAPSPLVVGDLLVLEAGGGPGKGVAALDRKTGEVRWTALDGGAGSSSALLAKIGGVDQILFHRPTEVVALSLDGQVLWRHPSAPDAIVMPLVLPEGRVFVSTATMEKGGVLVEVSKTADGFSTRELWSQFRLRNHFNTAVHLDGVIYGFDNATLRAVDAATGELRWAARGYGKGSLVAGDGLLFVLGDDGLLALVEASPEAYRELGRVQALGGRSWTSPTLAGHLLVVRDHDEIAAFDVRRGGAAVAAPASSAVPATRPRALPATGEATVETVVERYTTARGGLEAWRRAVGMRLEGVWATFSEPVPFVWVRRRGEPDHYRLEHRMLGYPFLRGRDEGGLWWQTLVLDAPQPVPPGIPEYLPQLEWEALFEPPLLAWWEKGLRVELVGAGEVDGKPTVDLRVTWPGSGEEAGRSQLWHLDPETGLELTVDDIVVDATQGPGSFNRRTFFGDFRPVEGLVLPHRVSMEFGARLEEIEVERVEVLPELPAAAVARPVVAPEEKPAGEKGDEQAEGS